MECEMCGKKSERLRKVKIDSAIMSVCQKCEKFGTPLENMRVQSHSPPQSSPQQVFIPAPRPPVRHVPGTRPKNFKSKKDSDIENMEIVPEYPEMIKSARAKIGISQEEMADKLKEKRTLIAAIERGSIKPDIKTARKIENLLSISLIEKV